MNSKSIFLRKRFKFLISLSFILFSASVLLGLPVTMGEDGPLEGFCDPDEFHEKLMNAYTQLPQDLSENPAMDYPVPANQMKLIVPAYKHPYDGVNNISDNAFWNALNSAADILGDRLVVIVSLPDPITQGDVDAYKIVIDELQRRGATVLGYLSMYYGVLSTGQNANLYALKGRLDRSRAPFYGGTFEIDGIFYDEAHLTRLASLYAPLANETGAMGGGGQMAIFNPGIPIPASNANVWNGHKGWFVTSESDEAIFNSRKTVLNSMSAAHKNRSVILVHGMNANNWNTQFNYLKDNNFPNIYLTDDVLELDSDGKEIESPFDVLPTFFTNLVNAMR